MQVLLILQVEYENDALLDVVLLYLVCWMPAWWTLSCTSLERATKRAEGWIQYCERICGQYNCRCNPVEAVLRPTCVDCWRTEQNKTLSSAKAYVCWLLKDRAKQNSKHEAHASGALLHLLMLSLSLVRIAASHKRKQAARDPPAQAQEAAAPRRRRRKKISHACPSMRWLWQIHSIFDLAMSLRRESPCKMRPFWFYRTDILKAAS